MFKLIKFLEGFHKISHMKKNSVRIWTIAIEMTIHLCIILPLKYYTTGKYCTINMWLSVIIQLLIHGFHISHVFTF